MTKLWYEEMIHYTKLPKFFRIIPFLAFIDMISTLFAFQYGGQEQYPLPAFFINNGGTPGLIFYSIFIFIVLKSLSELFIIRDLNTIYPRFPRFLSAVRFGVNLFYLAAAAFWVSIILHNFLYPFNLDDSFFLINRIIIVITVLVEVFYLREELVELFHQI